MADSPIPAPPSGRGTVARGVAASAIVVAMGQLLSRVMGLVRETVLSGVFGSSPQMDSFAVVSAVPDMVYQLLLGGMVSAALVPVLSEYSGRGDREELERLASILLTGSAILFLGIILILEVAAPAVAVILGGGFDAELLQLTTRLIRLIVPSLAFFGAWGVTVAVLYARQQFAFPAMAAAVYNLGVILAALFLAPRLEAAALSLGVVLGALLQLVIVLPGLRDLRLRFHLDLRHPALRRIVVLYMPVVASLIVSNLGTIIDRNLASRAGQQALSWMRYATFLVQLPLGLVSVAIATAALPALARLTSEDDKPHFRRAFAGALRLVILLVAPASVGLLVLGEAGIRAVLEHGAFTSADTAAVTRTLLFYLPGLPFAAIDQPIVFAFYARKDTVTPVLVGIAGVCAYLLVGPLLAFGLGMGYIGLVIANSVQLTTHCIIMWIMLQRRVGSMAGHGLRSTTVRAVLASFAAGLAMVAALGVSQRLIPSEGTMGEIGLLLIGGGAGAVTYVGGLALLDVEEMAVLAQAVRRRLRQLAGSAE
ncbi:MAG: murein biosynthesis integral membrane protein MurJ [Anaerolineae bacterium]|nr:murein biosynthesis integral membrane protein MurJ [Anaerolineae bacterium]